MTIADEARANSIQCEMVKYAYRQTKDGVVVSFVVHPNDIPAALSTSHIGARYVAVLVQIGDDELPVQQPAKENKTSLRDSPATPRRQDKPAGAKRPWQELEPAQQAGIRSNEIRFGQFLEEEYADHWKEHFSVADCIKAICGCTNSRSELGTDPRKRILWHQLDKHFQAWDAKVRFNA